MTAPRIDDVQRAVAARFSVRLDMLLGNSRERRFARPRQVAMAIAARLAGAAAAARAFGRDHTTVLHAKLAVANEMVVDDDFAKAVEEIERTFGVSDRDILLRMAAAEARAIEAAEEEVRQRFRALRRTRLGCGQAAVQLAKHRGPRPSRAGADTKPADGSQTRRTRPCLCCGATFLSEGPHNRMCGKCRHESA